MRKHLKNIVLVLCILNLSMTVRAQYYADLFKVQYNHGFQRPYDASPEKSGFTELTADATLPVPINDNLAIVSGFNVERLSVAYNTGDNRETFYGIMMKAGVNMNHGSKWSGTYLFLPKISSDLNQIDSDHYQFGGLALVKKQRNRASWWKFGAYANSELSGFLFVPIVGFYFIDHDNYEVNLTLPLAGDINVQVARQIKTGVSFQGIVKSYYISDFPDSYLHKTNNELAAYGQFESGPLVFQLMMGSSIGRSFRTFAMGDEVNFQMSALKFGDNRMQLNQDFKDGIFLKTSLIYRFYLPD